MISVVTMFTEWMYLQVFGAVGELGGSPILLILHEAAADVAALGLHLVQDNAAV